MCDEWQSRIEREVLTYLVEHSEAQDTLEGIAGWWLLERAILSETAQVKEALGRLAAKKLILEREGQDTRTHYRINRRKLEAIRALLGQRKP